MTAEDSCQIYMNDIFYEDKQSYSNKVCSLLICFNQLLTCLSNIWVWIKWSGSNPS